MGCQIEQFRRFQFDLICHYSDCATQPAVKLLLRPRGDAIEPDLGSPDHQGTPERGNQEGIICISGTSRNMSVP